MHTALARKVVAALFVAAVATACTSEEAQTPRVSTESSADVGDASPPARDAGAIAVRVVYRGAPVIETLSVNKDTEQCGTSITIEKLAPGPGGGLPNVVVSLAGLAAGNGAPTTTPQLDQRGCTFRPRVRPMRAGELEVLNSDGILHNVHTYSTENPTINKAQPKFKKTMTVTLSEPEIVKVTCDVHSWMQAWVPVFPHAFFAVTGGEGAATIERVPAGTQTVELWHEVLGRRTREVEVRAGETTQLTVDWETS